MATFSLWLLLASVLTYQVSALEGSDKFVAFDGAVGRRLIRSVNTDGPLQEVGSDRVNRQVHPCPPDMEECSPLLDLPFSGETDSDQGDPSNGLGPQFNNYNYDPYFHHRPRYREPHRRNYDYSSIIPLGGPIGRGRIDISEGLKLSPIISPPKKLGFVLSTLNRARRSASDLMMAPHMGSDHFVPFDGGVGRRPIRSVDTDGLSQEVESYWVKRQNLCAAHPDLCTSDPSAPDDGKTGSRQGNHNLCEAHPILCTSDPGEPDDGETGCRQGGPNTGLDPQYIVSPTADQRFYDYPGMVLLGGPTGGLGDSSEKRGIVPIIPYPKNLGIVLSTPIGTRRSAYGRMGGYS